MSPTVAHSRGWFDLREMARAAPGCATLCHPGTDVSSVERLASPLAWPMIVRVMRYARLDAIVVWCLLASCGGKSALDDPLFDDWDSAGTGGRGGSGTSLATTGSTTTGTTTTGTGKSSTFATATTSGAGGAGGNGGGKFGSGGNGGFGGKAGSG